MSGRIRTLKPELLEDEKLSNLDAGARLLFIACILLCDDHGCFRAAPSFLAGQAFWGSRRDARKVPYWFSQLVELGFLKTYVVRGQQFGEVVNWKKHQKIDHAGVRRLPSLDEADEVAPEQVPAKKLRSGKSSESLAKSSETLARTSENLATDLDQDLDLDQDQERERDRPAPARPGKSSGRSIERSDDVRGKSAAKGDAEPNASPPKPNPGRVGVVEAERPSTPRAATSQPIAPSPRGDGAQNSEAPIVLSAEGRELFDAMQKHDELKCLSPRFADKLAGEAMSSGQSIGSMRTAIGEAASELAARLEGGAQISPSERASLVRRYVAQARRMGERAVASAKNDSRSGGRRDTEREPTAEEIRAMYPLVQGPLSPLKPGEKMVPPEHVNALLASLMKHGGRGGVMAKAPVPVPVEPVAEGT